jgi:5,10-methylenetetrahydromethanopterin reductase
VQFGIAVFQDAPLPTVVEWMRDAEAVGYDWVVFPDSPALIRELYVTCATFADISKRAAFGPMVTNPVTRDVSVTAGAMFSLDELAPGRARLGIGAGDSAVFGVGMHGRGVDALEEYIVTLKALWRGEEVVYQGRRFRAQWRHWQPPVDVKVYVSAHGPRTMRMAARVADGVISGFGMRPENIAFVRETVAEAASAAGRDPAEVEIWWHPFVTLARSREEEEFVGMTTHFLTRVSQDDKQIPDHFREPIRLLAEEARRLDTHGRHNPRMQELAHEMGIFDYLLEREGGLVGSPEEMQAVVRGWEAAGADRILFAPLGRDFPALARRLADDVVSAFMPPVAATSGPPRA